jgi:hypothetical protein
MNAPRTNCTVCGRDILQSTADRKGGLCAPCEMKASTASRPQPKFVTPVPPVSRATLDDLIIAGQSDRAISVLFELAEDKVNFRPDEMTEGDIIVYTVETFLGETCNGGFGQYLTNQSGGWAHHCGSSLRKIGADKYADLIEECIRRFTTASSPQDPRWEADLDAFGDFEDDEDDPLKDLEERFFEFYFANKQELRDLLYRYICENRDLFAPFSLKG